MARPGTSDAPDRPAPLILSDTGIETDLIFHQGVDLPMFAAFVVADSDSGRALLDRWHREHAAAATAHGLGVSLDAVTWRASSDWGDRLGYDAGELDRVNHDLVRQLHDIRDDLLAVDPATTVLVGAVVGPRGDGYRPAERMSVEEAAAYHRPQLISLLDAGVDRVSAMTIGYADEAAGIASAAKDLGVPVILGLTVETDGRLPDGTTLAGAVAEIDGRTDGSAAGFMVNCAHPHHIAAALAVDAVDAIDASRLGPRVRTWVSGRAGSSPCAPTPPGAATPSSTRPRTWTTATRMSSRPRSPNW